MCVESAGDPLGAICQTSFMSLETSLFNSESSASACFLETGLCSGQILWQCWHRISVMLTSSAG